MRIATYQRISTDEERQPFSLEAQTDRLAAYIAVQPGWRLTHTYSDQMSGKRLDRPGLAGALAAARAGRYDLLLVFKVDRLARSVGGLARILEELDAAGVAFRSASEPFDTSTAAGRMMVQMLGVFAEFEREMIVERTRMGLARKAAKGEWTGGTPPFGYRYDPARRLLVPIPEQAAIVRRVFILYVERGQGSAVISGLLNDKGHRTRSGGRWTPNRVLDILRNPTYTGLLPFNGQTYPAGHEPLVAIEVFLKARNLLEERSEAPKLQAANATDYLLTSLLRCRRCGHGFVGTAAFGKRGRYRYYTCSARQRHGTARSDQERIPADSLEDAIVTEVLKALDDGTLFQEAALRAQQAWQAAHPGRRAELAGVQQALAERRQAVDRYLRAFEAGELPEGTCGYRVEELEREIAALEGRRAAAGGRVRPGAGAAGRPGAGRAAHGYPVGGRGRRA
ncbi:MAG TPA: recombinase family protein [Actinomycetes bacterium]|jgi:site-specific DNA recombinase|nr:recombinase family protein [Actinomycetes bacterium]